MGVGWPNQIPPWQSVSVCIRRLMEFIPFLTYTWAALGAYTSGFQYMREANYKAIYAM